MTQILSIFRALIADECGATSIEYGLISSLIAIAIISSVDLVGASLEATFEEVADAMSGPAAPTTAGSQAME